MDRNTIPRDRPFEPWRRPKTALGRQIVEKAIWLIKAKESRKRARRACDEASMRETVAALIADAVCCDLDEPGRRISVPLSNQVLGRRSRYASPALSRQLREYISRLCPEYLIVTVGEWRGTGSGMRTTVGITPEFRHHLHQLGCSTGDFEIEEPGELLELRAAHCGGTRGQRLDYRDSDFTMRERVRLGIINCALAKADVAIVGRPERPVDLNKRKLRRVFNNGSFDQGGRLFGGAWMEMSKRDRERTLRLDGERIATLDYRQMMPRLLYAKAGILPPHDCYAVPGYEAFRPGWKKLLNTMMYKGVGLKRCPREMRPLLPKKMPIAEAERRLIDMNKPIAPLLQPGVGFGLMFLESQLLVDVLIELERRGITALPIHDAVIVPVSSAEETEEVMCSAFEQMTGYDGAVSIELSVAEEADNSRPSAFVALNQSPRLSSLLVLP